MKNGKTIIASGIIHFYRRKDPKNSNWNRYEAIIKITHTIPQSPGYKTSEAMFKGLTRSNLSRHIDKFCQQVIEGDV